MSNNPFEASDAADYSHGMGNATAGADVRPIGLTVIAILCALGGALGIMAAVFGSLQLAFGDQFASAMTPADGPGADAQIQMQADMQAINRQFMIPNTLMIVGLLFVSVGLLVGGIAVFLRRSWSLTWLIRVLMVTAVFEVVRGGVYIIMQLQLMPVMQKSMARLSEETGGPPSMAEFAKIGMVIGLVFWGGWAIAKLVGYALAIRYLHQPAPRQYLRAAEPGEPAEPAEPGDPSGTDPAIISP